MDEDVGDVDERVGKGVGSGKVGNSVGSRVGNFVDGDGEGSGVLESEGDAVGGFGLHQSGLLAGSIVWVQTVLFIHDHWLFHVTQTKRK